MKEKTLRFRMSERRYNRLKLYAEKKEKTMTQLVEEWVDRLPSLEESPALYPRAKWSTTIAGDEGGEVKKDIFWLK
ncbi:hypothetical protein DP114_20455 [Brasilonema sennae CENA114]|uniref:CopG family transcriptional regulator n=2 Tax=Brasilonema TaxID=383614 RepID=A0A856MK06_9CYAN|nr:hypothetical protein [Brasilonema octagenarum UFV-OR1]QDL09941.1 hypothetical protein DP114_20455 [Brasilonema sennae CENA114]